MAERDAGMLLLPRRLPLRRIVLVVDVARDRYSLTLLGARTGVKVATAARPSGWKQVDGLCGIARLNLVTANADIWPASDADLATLVAVLGERHFSTARQLGYEQIALGVGLDDPKARRLYERLGYGICRSRLQPRPRPAPFSRRELCRPARTRDACISG